MRGTRHDAHQSRFHPDAHVASVALLQLEQTLGSRKAVAAIFRVGAGTIGSWLSTKIPRNRVNEIIEEARKRLKEHP